VLEALGPDPGVRVVTRVGQQRPAAALAEEAAHADLLVIGSHGRGELPDVRPGSLVSYCTHHAACLVVVAQQARPLASGTPLPAAR